MPPRRGRRAVLGALSLLLLLPHGCSRGGEADRLRELVARGAERAEQRDVAGLLALATEDIRVQPGNRGPEQIREALATAFYYYRRFRIRYPRPAVTIEADGRSARVVLPFLVVRDERAYPGLDEFAQDPGAWLARVGENADLYHLGVELEMRDTGWLVRGATLRGYGVGAPGG